MLAVLATTWHSWCGTGWRLLAWRCRVCASAALLLTVMLSLLEPLACLSYCQNWAQLHSQRTSVIERLGTPAQSHATMTVFDDRSSATAHPQATVQGLYLCFGEPFHDLPSDAPAHLLHHEHLAAPVAVAFLVLVVLIQAYQPASPPTPPRRELHPPLRPPIVALP
jgi:hypothetical protein